MIKSKGVLADRKKADRFEAKYKATKAKADAEIARLRAAIPGKLAKAKKGPYFLFESRPGGVSHGERAWRTEPKPVSMSENLRELLSLELEFVADNRIGSHANWYKTWAEELRDGRAMQPAPSPPWPTKIKYTVKSWFELKYGAKFRIMQQFPSLRTRAAELGWEG
jgi:hypothetical protein